MITYTLFYPYKKDSRFDMDYYRNKNLSIAKSYFSDACKGILVLKGDSEKDKIPIYACICHLFFSNKKDFFKVLKKQMLHLLQISRTTQI